MIKKLPAVQETLDTRVLSLGQEDPLKKDSQSSIFAWRIPWTRILKGYGPQDCKEPDLTEVI